VAVPIINSAIEHEAWTADEMKIVERCDDILRHRSMQMAILCEDCFYAGRPPKVVGDNKRDSHHFSLTCACKRRIYSPPVS
jgi:hypothetical protein